MVGKRGFVARCAGPCLLWLSLASGCQKVDHPPPALEGSSETPDGGSDGGVVLPNPSGEPSAPAPDGSVACGGQRIQAVIDRPSLYFVIDVSGSMEEPITRSGPTKYVAARRAIGNMLRAIGHRVRYGAMVYPASAGESSCDGGKEILALSDGDPLGDPAENGPLLQVLLNRLASRSPGGGTPTAAALAQARTALEAGTGRRHVILATDGAPNCGASSTCPSERCIPDIEGYLLNTAEPQVCGVDLSCCAPGVIEDPGPALCVDDEATLEQVATLADISIPTYVIGMPGSEAYAAVLGRLAETGGTAREGRVPYYAVTDEPALTEALVDIGAGLTIGCEIALDSAPEDPSLVNVYFDREVVPQDAADGWLWTGEQQLTLRGKSCETLQSGDVSDVVVVYGCRTVVR